MLHLFNKVYLEFDDNIEIGFDRVVISQEYGSQMLQALDKVAYGELLAYGKTYDDVVSESFVGFISSLKDFGNRTGKRVIIYCDRDAYKKMISQWFKVVLPSLDVETFKTIIEYTIYNQRVVSNTQLSSVHSISVASLWEDMSDISEHWEAAKKLTDNEKQAFKMLGINFSYEFLMATYLSGDTRYKEELRRTMHMFMRRWFSEVFTDNRQMVLLNLPNHKFQTTFGIDPEQINLTAVDPLENIPQLAAYSDDEIWERGDDPSTGIYGTCNLQGISKAKCKKLTDTILNIYAKFEGMEIDRSMFQVVKEWLPIASRDTITDEEMEEVIEYVVEQPFDTNLIPRFNFETVNFPLFLYILDQKFKSADLSKFRLF
jgi:hypothetical protein